MKPWRTARTRNWGSSFRRLPGRQAARSFRPLHRAGKGPKGGNPEQSAGYPAHELHDAGTAAHAERGSRAGARCTGPAVPRVRRTSYLSRPSGRGRGAADPALPAGLRRHDIICVGTSATMASGGTPRTRSARWPKSPRRCSAFRSTQPRSSAKPWNGPRRRWTSRRNSVAALRDDRLDARDPPEDYDDVPPSIGLLDRVHVRRAAPSRHRSTGPAEPRGDCTARTARPRNWQALTMTDAARVR